MDKNLLRVDDPIYQTLSEFFYHPFGNPYTAEAEKLNPKYEQFKSQISVVGYSTLDDTYYIHIKVPSESQPGKKYDVVIQFVPTTGTMSNESNLNNYVIQFFSNSPSFIYKYSALYKLHGYMITALHEKLDPEYSDRLPEKANSDMKLMYDKSIYFAVRFLYDNRLTYLSKSALRYIKKLSFREMVDSIVDNKTALKTSTYDIEKQAIEENKVDRGLITKQAKRLFPTKESSIVKKVSAKSNTTGLSLSPVKQKISGKSKRAKVSAKTTTRKKS